MIACRGNRSNKRGKDGVFRMVGKSYSYMTAKISGGRCVILECIDRCRERRVAAYSELANSPLFVSMSERE